MPLLISRHFLLLTTTPYSLISDINRSMRTPFLVAAILLIVSTAALAQHANDEVLGGKTTPDKPTSSTTSKKPVSKATASRTAPLYSPCGVYYKNRSDMSAESNLGDKWFSLGQSANKRF